MRDDTLVVRLDTEMLADRISVGFHEGRLSREVDSLSADGIESGPGSGRGGTHQTPSVPHVSPVWRAA